MRLAHTMIIAKDRDFAKCRSKEGGTPGMEVYTVMAENFDEAFSWLTTKGYLKAGWKVVHCHLQKLDEELEEDLDDDGQDDGTHRG